MSKILGILSTKVVSGTTIPIEIASNPSNLKAIEEEIKRLEQEQEQYNRDAMIDYQERLDKAEQEAKRYGIYYENLKKKIKGRNIALSNYMKSVMASNSNFDFYLELKKIEEEVQRLKQEQKEDNMQLIDYEERLNEMERQAKKDGIYDEDVKERIEQARQMVIDSNIIGPNPSNLKKIEEKVNKIKQIQKESDRQAIIHYQARLQELDKLEQEAKRDGIYDEDLKEKIEQAKKISIQGYNKLLLLIAMQNLTSEVGIDALEAEDFYNIDTRSNSAVRMSFNDQPGTSGTPTK